LGRWGNRLALSLKQGSAQIRRTWQPGDVVELALPMPVRRVVSHPTVPANQGRVALQRGPLVYCVEGVDNGGRVSHLTLPDGARLRVEARPDLLNGVTVIQADERGLVAIPYYAWSHRGEGEMAVWLARGDNLVASPAILSMA
jgi:hypothetical protein